MLPAGLPSIVFRAAGGPRLGFGHIVRALSLAKALAPGMSPRLSLRGTRDTQQAAKRLGVHIERDALPTVLRKGGVALVVIDDPDTHAAEAALAIARRHGVMVASLHDLGLAPIASDLAIDGSLPQPRSTWPAAAVLTGARYAVLDPKLLEEVAAHRHALSPCMQGDDRHEGRRVLVSLGGGSRVAAGLRIARALTALHPQVRVTLAAGFAAAGPGGHPKPTGHPRVRWLESPGLLRCELARADVAVLAGGLTLYEAAALGVPAVAVAVVPAQLPTVRGFERAEAIFAAGLLQSDDRARTAQAIANVVRGVGELLADEPKRRRLAAQAQAQVDGCGASRVAAALTGLLARRAAPERRRPVMPMGWQETETCV